MERVRLFVAVRMPGEIRRRVAEIERQLMASGADVKWVSEENLHITMKFLGYVEEDRLDAVCRAVESAVAGMSVFDVALSGVEAFPNPRRPSVIWVGVASGGEELAALAERIESALERIGFARDDRPFSPHVTVGRVKSPALGMEKLREAMDRFKESPAGSFGAEGVTVMRSDLRPTGPIYTHISECGFH